MTVELADWQFELNGVAFGVGQPVAVSRFERGGYDIRDQDQPAINADARHFGRDRKTPGLWSWDLYTDRATIGEALDSLEQIEGAWDAETVRLEPSTVLPLRYRLGGRTRRVYGRPRRFTSTPTHLARSGRIEAVADFALAETGSYADVAQSVPVGVGRAQLTGVGVTSPVTSPVIAGQAGQPQQKTITVGGTRPTWLSLLVSGPIYDPYVIVGQVSFQFRGGLTAGETLLVSGVPWDQGLFRQDGSSASTMLDPTARLANLRVAPGSYPVTFGGIDSSGTATAAVSWRDAFQSI